MKKIKRRILSLILAVVLLMAMACVVSAATISWQDSDGAHSISVTGLAEATYKVKSFTSVQSQPHKYGTQNQIPINTAVSVKYYAASNVPSSYTTYFSQVLSASGVQRVITCTIPAGDHVTIAASKPTGAYIPAVSVYGKSGTCTVTHGTSTIDGGSNVVPRATTETYAISFAPYRHSDPYPVSV